MSKIILFIVFFFAGILCAVGFFYYLGNTQVRFDVRKPEIVGFLPYWLLDKTDKNYSHYITTLTYFGLSLNNDGRVKKLNNPQEEEPGYTNLKGYKVASHVKNSLLVISGDDSVIGDMINDPVTSANNLIADVSPIMKEKGFTDLNLDIESFMDASESARANFTTFVRTVKQGINATVTLDLIPISLIKQKLYDAKALGAIVDRVVLMTYDYHYSGSYTSGAVAPIGGAGETIEFDVETAVKEALKVMPREKILLGIPLYGYQWETISGASESATIPGGSSTASVRRVAEIIQSCTDCTGGIAPLSKEPYLIFPANDYFNQIYYENEASMKEKVALAGKYHLGGVALWALGYEDSTMLRPLTTYKNTLDLSGLY